MDLVLSDKHIQSVIRLQASQRYEYFINKIADQQEIWGLWKNGWAMYSNDNGEELVPFWPHAEYAKLCATGIWDGFQTKNMDMEAFLNRWLAGLEQDHRSIAIFPTPINKGIMVDAERLKRDLLEELSKYE